MEFCFVLNFIVNFIPFLSMKIHYKTEKPYCKVLGGRVLVLKFCSVSIV